MFKCVNCKTVVDSGKYVYLFMGKPNCCPKCWNNTKSKTLNEYEGLINKVRKIEIEKELW